MLLVYNIESHTSTHQPTAVAVITTATD